MAECLELLALGQADWLRRFSSGRDARPPEEIERKKDQHELTKAAHITLKALAPFETDLRQWLREKMQGARE
jgi:hypothetical protein